MFQQSSLALNHQLGGMYPFGGRYRQPDCVFGENQWATVIRVKHWAIARLPTGRVWFETGARNFLNCRRSFLRRWRIECPDNKEHFVILACDFSKHLWNHVWKRTKKNPHFFRPSDVLHSSGSAIRVKVESMEPLTRVVWRWCLEWKQNWIHVLIQACIQVVEKPARWLDFLMTRSSLVDVSYRYAKWINLHRWCATLVCTETDTFIVSWNTVFLDFVRAFNELRVRVIEWTRSC